MAYKEGIMIYQLWKMNSIAPSPAVHREYDGPNFSDNMLSAVSALANNSYINKENMRALTFC
jgi:hypothetical protein